MPLTDARREGLPPEVGLCLELGRAGRFFPRSHDFGFSATIWGLLLIPVLVFLFHCFVTVRAGKPIKKDDWVPAALVLGPLSAWGTSRLLREWRRKKLSDAGRNPLGAYLADDFVVWQVEEDCFHVVYKHELTGVEVTAASLHRPAQRAMYVAREIILDMGEAGKLAIGDAGDYDWWSLVGALEEWHPGLTVTVPDVLREPRVAPPWPEKPQPEELEADVLDPAGAALSDDPLQHFEQLLEMAGIRVMPAGGSPDGTICHRMERPLVIRRRDLDGLFDLVLRESESLRYVVAPEVADAPPDEVVAVRWFDHGWHSYASQWA